MIAAASQRQRIASLEDLLSRSLREQAELSAVERYAESHASGALSAHESRYRSLMPATEPEPGQQYSFEVDMDKCTACKACVAACHSLNGLEENETWRRTGLLVGGTAENPFQQTITTACHHCAEPACMDGCPVNAYEKDNVTGIVRHLDDQCIGCKYCTLTCPYEVPQYSKKKGIVRKCDMCTNRLSVGEAPACVQACPNQAIRIRVVDTQEVIENSEAGIFLPGAASPEYTMPTTNYKSNSPLPKNVLPADYHTVRKEDAHVPLVLMLVLTQLSVGTFLWDYVSGFIWGDQFSVVGRPVFSAAALGIGLLALLVSTLHLGRPHLAFRAILGLKRSWLSREILTFGLFAAAAMIYVLTQWTGLLPAFVPEAMVSPLELPVIRNTAFSLTVLFGVSGVFSSVMVYAVTKRPLWRGPASGFKFFATSLLLGMSLMMTVSTLIQPSWGQSVRIMCLGIVVLTLAKLSHEIVTMFHMKDSLHSPFRRAAVLMMGTLKKITLARMLFSLVGGIALPGIMLATEKAGAGSIVTIGFIALLVGEFLERYLYFTTSVSTRMPGGPVNS